MRTEELLPYFNCLENLGLDSSIGVWIHEQSRYFEEKLLG